MLRLSGNGSLPPWGVSCDHLYHLSIFPLTCLALSDIDLVVLCPTMPSPPLKPSSSLLHRLASLLLTSSLAEPSSLVVIAKARVPIVKFVTRYGGFSVDLSVNQKNGVDAAVRVRGMLEEFAFREEAYVEPGVQKKEKKTKKGKGKEITSPPVVEEDINLVDQGVARSLVMLVKAFLNQRGMNEVFTGGLGSYSIICLVISFLQVSLLSPRGSSPSLILRIFDSFIPRFKRARSTLTTISVSYSSNSSSTMASTSTLTRPASPFVVEEATSTSTTKDGGAPISRICSVSKTPMIPVRLAISSPSVLDTDRRLTLIRQRRLWRLSQHHSRSPNPFGRLRCHGCHPFSPRLPLRSPQQQLHPPSQRLSSPQRRL